MCKVGRKLRSRTRISVKLLYDPKSFIEATGETVGVVSSRVENNLNSFKEFIENRGQETAFIARIARARPRDNPPRCCCHTYGFLTGGN